MERDFRPMRPPIREGEEVDVRIESVGAKGDGVTKVKGFVVFVPSTKEGEEVKVRITRVLRKYAFGEVVKRLEPGTAVREEAPEGESEEGEISSEEPEEEAEGEGEGEEGSSGEKPEEEVEDSENF